MLDKPFLLMLTHPLAFAGVLALLFVWCMLTTDSAFQARAAKRMPDPAFLATFATPSTRAYSTPLRVAEAVTTWSAAPTPVIARPSKPVTGTTTLQARRTLNRTLAAALRAVDLGHYVTDADLWTRVRTLAEQRVADHNGNVVKGCAQAVASVVAVNAAAKSARPVITLPVGLPTTHHTPASSTERMRAQRAAHKAAGLTARGTTPMPVCVGTTKAGTPCKRKATQGSTCCTAHS